LPGLIVETAIHEKLLKHKIRMLWERIGVQLSCRKKNALDSPERLGVYGMFNRGSSGSGLMIFNQFSTFRPDIRENAAVLA